MPSHRSIRRILHVTLLVLVPCCLPVLPTHAEDLVDAADQLWWDGFDLPGILGTVQDAVLFEGDVILAGDLHSSSHGVFRNIVRWDGQELQAVGGGLDFEVQALAVVGSELLAGGWEPAPPGPGTPRLARWDGHAWTSIACGEAGSIQSLCFFRGRLFVGGQFTVDGREISLATLQGDRVVSEWVPDLVPATIKGLLVYEDQLIASGQADPLRPKQVLIASFDGSQWLPMYSVAAERKARVERLKIVDGNLVAVQFEYKGRRVLIRSGREWQTLGEHFYASDVADQDGRLLGLSPAGIMQWSGSAWVPAGSGLGARFLGTPEENLKRMWSLDDTHLILAGRFFAVDGVSASCVASWDGNRWIALGPGGQGANRPVQAMTEYDGELVAAGSFTTVGSTVANHIASWNGVRWKALGEGLDNVISHLHVYDGDLIATGAFHLEGTVGTRSVARWDGQSWQAMGELPDGTQCLATHDGILLAGGDFQLRSGFERYGIAQWDGQQWVPFAATLGGTEDSGNPDVNALAEYNGELVAAGLIYDLDGAQFAHIARWDGIRWNALAPGGVENAWLSGIRDLQVHDGKLIALGCFDRIDHVQARNVASWDGTSWSALGDGLPGFGDNSWQLAEFNSGLFAAGFQTPGIVHWTGARWEPMGHSTSGVVVSMQSHQGYLYVGGSFWSAGASHSFNIARWGKGIPDLEPQAESRLAVPVASQLQLHPIRLLPDGTVQIRYEIMQDVPTLQLRVFDVRGRTVRSILAPPRTVGQHTVLWNRLNDRRESASPGVYFVRLRAFRETSTAKLVLTHP